MLQRANQAMTIDPNRLQIGIASTIIGGVDMGALTEASVEITTTVKDRYEGYPAQRMQSITESVTAIATITAEEVGGAPLMSLLTNLFSNLETQNATTYSIEMLAGFAGGGNLSMVSKAQLLPELTIDWQDNWSSVKFKFECIGKDANSLIKRSNVMGDRITATTVNTTSLSIGKPKVIINGSSIGAIQGAVITLAGTTKKTASGYPSCTAGIIYLDSKFEIVVIAEEGELVPQTDCQVKLQQALVDGSYLEFEFPHCSVQEDASIATVNDWLGYKCKILPFKVEGSKAVNFKRV